MCWNTLATGNHDLIAFVERNYPWAKTHVQPSTHRIFPERMNLHHPRAETCEIADMIAIALKLTEAGGEDYQNDADRWIRNQFVEKQLTDIDWVDDVVSRLVHAELAGHCTVDRVAARNLGAFAGWAAPNEWDEKLGIQHCCTGNAARALYYIWEHTLTDGGEGLTLNLLLNHATAAADVAATSRMKAAWISDPGGNAGRCACACRNGSPPTNRWLPAR